MDRSTMFVDVLEQFVRRSQRNPKQLANLTSLPIETIKNWLEGRVRRPRDWRDIVRLARALHLTEAETTSLLCAAGHPAMCELMQQAENERDRQLVADWMSTAPATPGIAASNGAGIVPLDRLPQPAPLPVGSRMPLRRNALFVGRGDTLLGLARTLGSAEAAGNVTALTGLGGVGKTQLAVEFVHRYGRFFSGGVFWLSFADPLALPGEVAACGEAEYQVLRPDFAKLPLAEKVSLARASWQDPAPRLLVFDNCEDAALLAEWLPASGGSRVLVTSRRRDWPSALGIHAHNVNEFTRDESLALLTRHLPDLRPDDASLDALAAELGDLPLALHVAASYLARYRPAVSPDAYVDDLRRVPLLEHPSFAASDESLPAPAPRVARSFELSYQRLDHRSPVDALAQALLARAACLAPGRPIPRELLAASSDGQDDDAALGLRIVEALNRLGDLGLISVDPGGAARVHRLIVSFVRRYIADPDTLAETGDVMLRLANRLNAAGNIQAMLGMQPHLHHLAEVAGAQALPSYAGLAESLGYHLWMIGKYRDAELYVQHALAARVRQGLPDTIEMGETYSLLGLIYQLPSRFGEARVMFERAIAIWEREAGPDDERTIDDVHNLGYLSMLQARYDEAEALMRRALEVRRQIYGLRHRQIVRSLIGLGYLYLLCGRPRAAWRYLVLAYRIAGVTLPAKHRVIALTLTFLAQARLALGDYDAAEDYLNRAAEMWEALCGAQNFGLAETLYVRGQLLHRRGDMAGALTMLEQALDMTRRTLGERTRDMSFVQTALGCVLRDLGRLNDARSQLEQAIALTTEILGPEHPDTATAQDELGLVLLACGDAPAARALIEHAFAIRERALQPDHPALAASRRHLELLDATA